MPATLLPAGPSPRLPVRLAFSAARRRHGLPHSAHTRPCSPSSPSRWTQCSSSTSSPSRWCLATRPSPAAAPPATPSSLSTWCAIEQKRQAAVQLPAGLVLSLPLLPAPRPPRLVPFFPRRTRTRSSCAPTAESFSSARARSSRSSSAVLSSRGVRWSAAVGAALSGPVARVRVLHIKMTLAADVGSPLFPFPLRNTRRDVL